MHANYSDAGLHRITPNAAEIGTRVPFQYRAAFAIVSSSPSLGVPARENISSPNPSSLPPPLSSDSIPVPRRLVVFNSAGDLQIAGIEKILHSSVPSFVAAATERG